MSDVQSALSLWVRRLNRRTPMRSAEMEALLALEGRLEHVARYRNVVKQGEVATEACLVVSGVTGRFKQNSDGLRQLTALHIQGDMPDLHSVVLPKSPSALTSLSDTKIFRISHTELRTLARHYPQIAEAFWHDSTVDADIATEWIFVIGRLPALPRIAHLLCELSLRYEVISSDPSRFTLDLTQEHIGDATGLTSVHVNRMLRELRETGLVHFSGGEVIIHNRGALAQLGEFTSDYLHLDDRAKATA